MKNKKIFKLSLILISSGLITSSLMAAKINPVVNFSQYPINKSVASVSHGGDLSDKVAATDGIGTLLIGKIGNKTTGETGINNSDYNKLVKENLNKLTDDTTTFNDLITNGKVDINKYPKINENKFISKITSVIGSSCDDGNPNTTNDVYTDKSGTCKGTICDTNINYKQNLENAIITGQDVTNFNTSCITNMSNLFYDIYIQNHSAATSFNQNINNWDVSNVTNMNEMFDTAFSFNQSLSNWNVSNVTDISAMFHNARSFNQPLNNWDVSNVTNMNEMFIFASSFNQPLNSWDVSKVTDMFSMFMGTLNFNQNISNWNVSNVTYRNSFRYNSALTTANSPSKNGSKF